MAVVADLPIRTKAQPRLEPREFQPARAAAGVAPAEVGSHPPQKGHGPVMEAAARGFRCPTEVAAQQVVPELAVGTALTEAAEDGSPDSAGAAAQQVAPDHAAGSALRGKARGPAGSAAHQPTEEAAKD